MPIRTYGVRSCRELPKIQYKQNSNLPITLQIIKNAAFYVSIYTLYYTDLRVNTVDETANLLYNRFRLRLTNHHNPLISALNSDIIPGNLRVG